MATSAINGAGKEVLLHMPVKEDGSVSLRITRPTCTIADLPAQIHTYTHSFLGIDSLFTLQKVDKRSRHTATNALKHFGERIAIESLDCSRLLTGVWNMAVARLENPREALARVAAVAINNGVLVLKDPSGDNYRYVEPKQLSALQQKLLTTSLINKLALAKTLISEALAFPPHLSVKFKYKTDRLHGMQLHAYFPGQVSVKHNESLFSIHRAINLEEKDGITFIFQLIASDLPALFHDNIKTISELHEELDSAIGKGEERAVAMIKEANLKDGGITKFSGENALIALSTETVFRNLLKQCDCTPQYTKLSWSMGSKYIDHQKKSEQE